MSELSQENLIVPAGSEHGDNASRLFDREERAGYNREIVAHGVFTYVGSGAGAQNEIQTTALVGVQEHRVIDHDGIDVSNATRSPLIIRSRYGTKRRFKAREVAKRIIEISTADAPLARYAVAFVQKLGLAAFEGTSVIMAAVDNFAARAYLSDVGALWGIPVIEGGFSGETLQISVFPHASPDEPCWRCSHPRVSPGGLSCTLYAKEVEASGRIPATQPLAATLGGLMTEAAIEALHGHFPLGNKSLHLNLRTGETNIIEHVRNSACPGEHRRLGEIRRLEVRSNEPVKVVLELAREFATDPVVRLPAPFVVEAPCVQCGRPVRVNLPANLLHEAPRCKDGCNEGATEAQGSYVIEAIEPRDPEAHRSFQSLGLGKAAIFFVEDRATDIRYAVQLEGSLDDLYTTLRRSEPSVIVDTDERKQ